MPCRLRLATSGAKFSSFATVARSRRASNLPHSVTLPGHCCTPPALNKGRERLQERGRCPYRTMNPKLYTVQTLVFARNWNPYQRRQRPCESSPGYEKTTHGLMPTSSSSPGLIQTRIGVLCCAVVAWQDPTRARGNRAHKEKVLSQSKDSTCRCDNGQQHASPSGCRLHKLPYKNLLYHRLRTCITVSNLRMKACIKLIWAVM